MGDTSDRLNPDLACEWEGHLWEDAGGGLYICMRCHDEQWEEDLTFEEWEEISDA